MSRIRPFVARDVPAVAEIKRIVFNWRRDAPAADREASIRALFLDAPFCSPALPSLVFEDDHGRVTGFKGVWPRDVHFHGETLRMAVSTHLMVLPESRGMAGIALMREFLNGPQDVSRSDSANDTARRLWARLGGAPAPFELLDWVRPLRPLRLTLAGVGNGAAMRVARAIARPLVAPLDAVLGSARSSRYRVPPVTGSVVPLTAGDLSARLEEDAASQRGLSPALDEASADWLLEGLRRMPEGARLRATQHTDSNGGRLGWSVRVAAPGGTSLVVKVGGDGARFGDVLDRLAADAHAEGAIALRGRALPSRMDACEARGCHFVHSGGFVLVHSRRREIADSVVRGESALDRLDGEWPIISLS